MTTKVTIILWQDKNGKDLPVGSSQTLTVESGTASRLVLLEHEGHRLQVPGGELVKAVEKVMK